MEGVPVDFPFGAVVSATATGAGPAVTRKAITIAALAIQFPLMVISSSMCGPALTDFRTAMFL
jgi:hypothetical protein